MGSDSRDRRTERHVHPQPCESGGSHLLPLHSWDGEDDEAPSAAPLCPLVPLQVRKAGPWVSAETTQQQMFFPAPSDTHVQHAVMKTGSCSLSAGKKKQKLCARLLLGFSIQHETARARQVGFVVTELLLACPSCAVPGDGDSQGPAA